MKFVRCRARWVCIYYKGITGGRGNMPATIVMMDMFATT